MRPLLLLRVFRLFASILAVAAASGKEATPPPNIVFLMADDHRAFCLGTRGDKAIHTPNLDKLANRGMSFPRCYATTPICMASRASVMTGLYEYRTGCNFGTGKLSAENWGPEALKLLPPQPKLGRQYAQRREWLPEETYQKHIRTYYRLISGIDMAVGMIVEALRKNGVADNTVVIYTSDNGYFCGAHGLQGKVLPYDDASLIPLIVVDLRNPEIAGKRSDALVGNIDFAPTMLDFAGVKAPAGIDGKSIVPMLAGSRKSIHDSLLIIQNWGWAHNDENRCLSVTDGLHKYIFWCYGDKNLAPVEELFDLRKDPYEMHNLAGNPEEAGTLKAMRAIYDRHHAAWARQCVDQPSYREHTAIFDRNIPWQKKKFRTIGGKAKSKSGRILAEIYKEVVGAPMPQEGEEP